MSFSALSFVRNASDLSSLGFQWRGRKGYRGPSTTLLRSEFVTFLMSSNSRCKQNSSTQLVITSKKSQTLRMTGRISLLCEKSG